MLPATAKIIASFIAQAEAAPEELSTIANVMPAPPMPFVPDEYHGQLVIMAMMAYAGGAEGGERALAPFRALAAPVADLVRPMPYPEIYPPDDPNYHPVATGRTLFMDGVDRRAAETMVEHHQASTAPLRVAQLRVLGGAMAPVPVEATAFAHRRRGILVNVAAVCERPDEAAAHDSWVTRFASALGQGEPGASVNFLGDEGEARIREAYPGSAWDRLVSIKARYDPTNLFQLNQNIPPAIGQKEESS